MTAGIIWMLLIFSVPLVGIVLLAVAWVRLWRRPPEDRRRVLAPFVALSFGIPALVLALPFLALLSYRTPKGIVYVPLLVGVALAGWVLIRAPGRLRLLCTGIFLLQVFFTFVVWLVTGMAMLPD